MLPSFPPLAFVDLETTGGDARVDRVTEVAVVTLIDGVVERWSRLVNPQVRIPPFIAQLTGITNAMVAGAPPFAEIAAELRARLGNCRFVAHNARFDYRFLQQEFRRLGQSFRREVLCTVRLSRQLYPAQRRHGLDQIIAEHGLAVGARHRALGDAQAICDFWHVALAQFGAPVMQQALATLTTRDDLPTHVSVADDDELPETHGVYRFYAADGRLLYVGRGRNVRAAVLRHFAGPALWVEGDCAHVIDRWRDCGTVRGEAELAAVLAAGLAPAPFDRDFFRLLLRQIDRLQPLGAAAPARRPWSAPA